MGLSRLDNFLKSVRGTILYVDPNSIDATDSIENQGNSLTRPFKTIQRALIEAARFSYQRGLDNDRFGKTTILLYPGDHIVDNRPGYIPYGSNNYDLRNGLSSDDFPPFDLISNFDLTSSNNQFYKLNSVYGGVIVPRGTSIVGIDLRKTVIRPKYVPDPENDEIERSAVFRVTGGCYFWQFTVLDADPNGTCYKDYNNVEFVPNFSHHKLTAFEYADGVNNVVINDDFISNKNYGRTDLDMYYEKIGLAYGEASGREIQPDYPSNSLDIEAKPDEYRIVGSRGAEVGITSIRAGDGSTSTTTITVTLEESLDGLSVDTPIRIAGVNDTEDDYNGNYVVSEVLSSTQIQYKVQNAPIDPLPSLSSPTLNISVDTVTSSSPYIFNISLRSVYGMCGLHADGDKASGFKSMVVAQFTGIGLQKDNNAFVKYDSVTGTYLDSTSISNLHTDSRARFKPSYENYHIKCSNDAYIQIVSVFAIGYANHFLAENGGDQSINNSNSNFGSKALVSTGFRRKAFTRDDVGYISHIIPPKVIENFEVSVEYLPIDVGVTTAVGISSHLYLYGYTNQDVRPDNIIEGYRIGAKRGETLNVLINSIEYSSSIIIPNTTNTTSEKSFKVGRSSVGVNSISSNTFTLTEDHNFENGEIIRIISNNGHIPDGLVSNNIYFAITNGVNSNEVKVAQSLNDAVGGNAISINNSGGVLNIVSRVSDKKPGDLGHPIQYDNINNNWYIQVSETNEIYTQVSSLGVAGLGDATSRTYINRTPDTRNILDTIYRLRYVIPADSPIVAKPPLDSFIIQESNNSIESTNDKVAYQFNPAGITLDNSTDLRNQRIIADASWSSSTATFITELPHDLKIGSEVEILNVTSTNNATGIAKSGFNGTFTVAGISSSKHFTASLSSNPGTITNNISDRTTSLPHFKQKKYNNVYSIYRSQEIQKYIPGERDGIYHLIVTNSSNSPSVAPFTGDGYSQPIQNLYPQLNRDNPVSDPKHSISFANPSIIGQVVVDEPQHSITKESLGKGLIDFNVGFGLTDIVSSSTTGTAHTFYTSIDHGLNPVTTLSIVSGGADYGVGSGSVEYYYNAKLVGFAGSTTGSNATARVTVSAAGTISNIVVMDGGSAYGVGNTMSVVGIATTGSSHTTAVVRVDAINNNIGDVLSLDGIVPTNYEAYNTLYRISGLSTSSEKEISVVSISAITGTTSGIGVTIAATANVIVTGKSLNVTSFVYDNVTGLATVTTQQNHGLNVGNPIVLSGADNDFYNGSFLINKNVGLTTFFVTIGKTNTAPATTGTIVANPTGFVAHGGNITKQSENISGRLISQYAGITTTLGAAISDATAGICSITNVSNLNLQIGDYLQVDEEIIRIKSTVTGNPVDIFRGLLGTVKAPHIEGSVVRKIKPRPIELRRNSMIRASGHTFEYLGFGPGNYSTAFPERQDRVISPQEELLSQSTKKSGGVVVFTGMNADGDFYVGNKKSNSTTGQEQVFDAPVPTITGEIYESDGLNVGFDVITPLEVSINRSLRVEGGPDSNVLSEFDGPVVFNNKLTSTSSKGIEANSLFLQGDRSISRKYTVGIATPSLAGNSGDVVFNATPSIDGYVGWVYTNNNRWEKFGYVGTFRDPRVGFSSDSNFIGIVTQIDFRSGTGSTVRTDFDSVSGVGTVIFDSSPLNVGISTGLGLQKTFVGVATEINFIGYGITITAFYNAGIASVTFDGSSSGGSGSPALPLNSIQYNNNGFFGGSSNLTYDGDTFNLKSSLSSGNIFVVEDNLTDSSPFVIDSDGNVGIKNSAPVSSLDVRGTTSVESLRLYETDRSNYVLLQPPSLTSNYTLTLPTTTGTANDILYTTGSGTLSWISPTNLFDSLSLTTDDISEGSNEYYTDAKVKGVIKQAIDNGTQDGIDVTYNESLNKLDFEVSGGGSTYPFTTRGFGYPL